MTEKELNKLWYINKRIARIKSRIEEIEQETGVGGIVLDGMPHSHNGKSIVEQIAIKRAELYQWLKEEELNKINEYLKVKNYIATVEDEEIKLIMEMRFIDNEVWETIAGELYYDPRTVARKMRRYLKTH